MIFFSIYGYFVGISRNFKKKRYIDYIPNVRDVMRKNGYLSLTIGIFLSLKRGMCVFL